MLFSARWYWVLFAGTREFIAYQERLFYAASDEDQWSTVIYFFCIVGYLMACAVIGDFVYDRPSPPFDVLDPFVIITLHLFASIIYLFYWISLSPDEYNPCYYYLPDFYWGNYFLRLFPI
uniref:Protein rolling stone-like n=1 Tax=Caenorhabditis tropicalis TaxID=1561998 RepID=A0A1I7TUU2_9PELO